MFKYKFLQLKKIKNKNFYFDFVQIHDIKKIRVLRNSNIQILRQKKKISIKKQNNYFFSQVKKSTITSKPNMILFSIYSNLKFIGYGGFVNIDWSKKIAELSFLTNIDVGNIKKNHEKTKPPRILLSDFTQFNFFNCSYFIYECICSAKSCWWSGC